MSHLERDTSVLLGMIVIVLLMAAAFIGGMILLDRGVLERSSPTPAYTIEMVEGMPCIFFTNGVSCDWSQWGGK